MSYLNKSTSRVVLEVDLGKIKSNFQKVCKSVASGKVTAVLKANAYGLGVMEVAKACKEAGADSFGVAAVNAALELKTMGLPVMILGNVLETLFCILINEYHRICSNFCHSVLSVFTSISRSTVMG